MSFNPDQERDDDGKWSSGGGGSPGRPLTMLKDGVNGTDLGVVDNFQYALSGTEVMRRKASEAGTYGGWRWEASKDQMLQYDQPKGIAARIRAQQPDRVRPKQKTKVRPI